MFIKLNDTQCNGQTETLLSFSKQQQQLQSSTCFIKLFEKLRVIAGASTLYQLFEHIGDLLITFYCCCRENFRNIQISTGFEIVLAPFRTFWKFQLMIEWWDSNSLKLLDCEKNVWNENLSRKNFCLSSSFHKFDHFDKPFIAGGSNNFAAYKKMTWNGHHWNQLYTHTLICRRTPTLSFLNSSLLMNTTRTHSHTHTLPISSFLSNAQ